MSMLAEARRKQKFSLNPRGAEWSNDDSKFGQKLMEKMGWSKGKGLGANEDGKVDHVSVSVKNDNRGVGCSKNHADNWLAHQDDFNALLSNLNQDHGGDTPVEADAGTKVTRLEQNSRTSKSRVHYHKFTKGKDLSLKSAVDLDCVMGKRKVKSESNTPTTQSEANSDASDEEGSRHGVITVKSTDSIQEYFAKKMAALKNGGTLKQTEARKGDNSDETCDSGTPEIENSDEMHDSEKVSKNSRKRKYKEEKVTFSIGQDTGFEETSENKTFLSSDSENINCQSSSKKKKSKAKAMDNIDFVPASDNSSVFENIAVDNSDDVGQQKSKKSKKKSKEKCKNDTEAAAGAELSDPAEVEVPTKKAKKKKSKKPDKVLENSCEATQASIEEGPSCSGKTKKKKSKKSNNTGKSEAAGETEKTGVQVADSQISVDETDIRETSNSPRDNVTNSVTRKVRLDDLTRKLSSSFKGSNVHEVGGYFGDGWDAVMAKDKLKKIQKNNSSKIKK